MIVQMILIRWMKDTRGQPYATSRNRHPAVFPWPTEIPSSAYSVQEEQILVHRLTFHQTVKGIERVLDTCEWIPMPTADIRIGHAKLPGLFPQRHAEQVEVRFCYDPSFGKPVRTDYRSSLLDELAFTLRDGEYGRIIINGRHTIEEGSLYEHRTFNVWNVADTSKLEKNRLHRKPDYMRTYQVSLW